MTKRIALIQGHPDAQVSHFCHALADEYLKGAKNRGHEVRCIDVATLDFPVLRTKEDFDHGVPLDVIKQAQDVIRWADHLVIIYPLWLGTMPALLKAFLSRPFALILPLNSMNPEKCRKNASPANRRASS